eukprot:8242060-Pyramimonas_sp.AAC.1
MRNSRGSRLRKRAYHVMYRRSWLRERKHHVLYKGSWLRGRDYYNISVPWDRGFEDAKLASCAKSVASGAQAL